MQTKYGLWPMILVVSSVTGSAHGAGFYIAEQSASGLGQAFAGEVAQARDASTVNSNPAGLTEFTDGVQVAVVGHVIAPSAEFSNNGSQLNQALTIVPTALGGANAENDPPAGIPNFYASIPVTDSLVAGFGVTVPFGLSTKYDEQWVGRYHAVDNEIKTFNYNLALGWKVNKQWSVGAGINYQTFEVSLGNKVDSFAACAAAATALGVPVVASCGGLGGAGVAANDTSLTITGEDENWGLNLGLTYAPTDATRIGLSWRQGVEHDLGGEARFERSAGCAGNAFCAGVTGNNDVRAELELPDVYSIGVVTEVMPKVRLSADASFYTWSDVQQIEIEFVGAANRNRTLDLQWNDTYRVGVGVEYDYRDDLTLRAGWAFDESPVENAALQTARLPDENRYWFSLGATWRVSPSFSIDAGYTHIEFDDIDINNASPLTSNHTLTGSYDATVDIVSLQANVRF
ncbi:MAG: OmpP1/FadL family transporter [Gammaproteobacteria bacterium]